MLETIGLRRQRELIWLLWFCLCLIQLNLPGGISANYLFALSPVVALLSGERLRYPPATLVALGLFYFAIYAAGMLGLAGVASHGMWRTASFLIFSSLFVFCVVHVTPELVRAFTWAVVVVSVAYSAEMIIRFYLVGVLAQYSELTGQPTRWLFKEMVGTQRLGFLLGVGYWLLVFAVTEWRRFGDRLAASLALAVVFSGMLLTFSRTSILALAGSIAIFAVWLLAQALRRGLEEPRFPLQALALVVAIHLGAIALFPEATLFYGERIFDFVFSGQAFVNMGVVEPAMPPVGYEIGETSEGTRMRIWSAIVEVVRQSPLLGNGFMGVWSVSEFGSAHNQYMDVLLRTGYPGVVAYLALLAVLTAHLFRTSKPLFFGMVAALMAGLFHETFKESNGAFLLAFFVGMYASRNLGAEPSRDDRIIPDLVTALSRPLRIGGIPKELEGRSRPTASGGVE